MDKPRDAPSVGIGRADTANCGWLSTSQFSCEARVVAGGEVISCRIAVAMCSSGHNKTFRESNTTGGQEVITNVTKFAPDPGNLCSRYSPLSHAVPRQTRIPRLVVEPTENGETAPADTTSGFAGPTDSIDDGIGSYGFSGAVFNIVLSTEQMSDPYFTDARKRRGYKRRCL